MSLLRTVATTAAAGLLLVSCGDGDEPDQATSPSPSPSPSPSSTVDVPPRVSLTNAGQELDFGGSATVVFEPNQRTGTVLRLTVQQVTEGSIRDLSDFVLDSSVRSSTPYYVDVRVENVGEGQVGGFAVPLYGVAGDTLLQASAFTTPFERCESEPLPDRFPGGRTFKSCLVYLVPEGERLEAVSFRPSQQVDAITWTGEIRSNR